MEVLKYKVISNKAQYIDYCKKLETLIFSQVKNKNLNDEIALLTLLIEKCDSEHTIFKELDPVQLLTSFMNSHNIKAKDLVTLLGISKSYVSEILNYKKGFSKSIIRSLSTYFKVSQEAFNRPYALKQPALVSIKTSRDEIDLEVVCK